jgi:hypothetical protein
MQEWQPIETAPKDGSAIIVVQNKVRAVAGWSRLGGYWQVLPCDPTGAVNRICPDHWMPLPPLPRPETYNMAMEREHGPDLIRDR